MQLSNLKTKKLNADSRKTKKQLRLEKLKADNYKLYIFI